MKINNPVIFKLKNERNERIRKNTLGLFFLKGCSILINLTLIPLTLNVLGDYRFGIWVTIFNVISWINIFDIGIGNGLRNKYTESISRNNIKEAREYVSTSYLIVTFIAILIIILFCIPFFSINWASVFNVKQDLNIEIKYLVGFIFAITCIQFILKLISTILIADHKSASAALLPIISNLLILLILVILKESFEFNLLWIGILYTTAPAFTYLVAQLILFNGKYIHVKPRFKDFKKDKIKSLFNLGIQFFIIQIAVLVIFQTDSLIISNKLSPNDVTPYNISFRYFALIPMLYTMIATPTWSAYTDAAIKKDFNWIKRTIKLQVLLMIGFLILSLLLFAIAKPVIKLWIGNDLNISTNLLVGMTIYSILSVWNGIFSALLGGLSKIRLTTFLTMFSALINIPLSLYLIKIFGNTSSGVIMATNLCLCLTSILSPIQAFYFIFTPANSRIFTKLFR